MIISTEPRTLPCFSLTLVTCFVGCAFTLLALLVPLAPADAAEPQAILARGFEPDQIYDFNDLDHVNLFNGNLVLTIPIGQRYPVNAGFEYGFTLVYNSHIWDYVIDCPGDGIDTYGEGDLPPLFLTDPASAGRACSLNQPPDQPLPNALRGIPNPKSNAGTGWRLTLGELYDAQSPLLPDGGWTFVGPDGAERRFLPPENDSAGTFPQFTRDGSHLRLSNAGSSPACDEVTGSCMTVERPDGVTYAFETAATPAGWFLRRIEDRFGNGVTITESGDSWLVTDSVDRHHMVTFDTDGVLASASLAAFDGATAEYTFATHVTDPMKPGCPHDFDIPGESELQSLVLLDSITLPDGSLYEMEYVDDDGSTGICTNYSGRLRHLTLPTGGSVDYEHGRYLYPTKPCDRSPVQGGAPPPEHLVQWGIDRRTQHDVDGTLLGETHYVNGGPLAAPAKQSYIQDGTEICIQPRTTFTDVYEKADGGRYKLTRHFFAIAQTQGGADSPRDLDRLPYETSRYGLPIDHLKEHEDHTEHYRSSMVFDCPSYPAPTQGYGPLCVGSEPGGCWPGDALHLQVPTSCYDVDGDGDSADRYLAPDAVRGLRDAYLEHESGGTHYCDGNPQTNADCDLSNWRIRSDVTYFYDSQGDYRIRTQRSDFDGYGHYRSTTSSSNHPGSVSRTVLMDYRPEVTAQTWLLGLIDEREVTEGGQSTRETYTYDRTTGFLTSRTTHRGGGSLTATFQEDDFGNVESETYSGGDPGQPGYSVLNEHENGSLSFSAYQDGGDTFLRTVDADIDQNTGLPSSSRDPSNLEIEYVFDSLGRLTDLTPQGVGTLAEAATEYTYSPYDPSTNTRASVTVTRGDTSTELRFDGLGRASEERTLLPGEVASRRFTIFTPMGQAKSVTTLHDATAIAGANTTETDYDIFGRPVRTDRPDGSHTTTFYDGIFKTVRTLHGVQTPDGPQRLRTRFEHDYQGRLITVDDLELSPSGTPDLRLRTRYDYDEGGRLVRVTQGGGTQERTFTYDEAGLLTEECHPELADGCITYSEFDAQGNPSALRYDAISAAGFGLDYRRDAAGRLIRVSAAADGRLLKEFFYNNLHGTGLEDDPANGNGKLYQSRRHNPFGSQTLVATTTHTYTGTGGRLSERSVATGGDGALPRVRFTTTFGYDELGNLNEITYPACDQAGCDDEAPPRTVHRSFTRGLLTEVGTSADADHYAALTYHPNLTLAQVLHGNGVRDAISQDPHQMPRPGGAEFRTGATAGAGTLWSASYSYDGAGNLASRQTSGYTLSGTLDSGTDLFRYDPTFNRLVSATVHYPAGGGVQSAVQGFSYDLFGNLTAVTGTHPRAFDPDPTTNRLNAPYTYDAAGNLTSQPHGTGGASLQQWFYSYDPFMMMTRASLSGGSIERNYLYTADDERLAVLTPARELWSLRGTGNEVLRDVEHTSAGWRWIEDYIHGGPGLLASQNDTGAGAGAETKHYHLDHLGSPRLVTDSAKTVLAHHVHAPYGEELTSPVQDELRMKFTGHERDRMDATDPGGDLDYMHARYYSGSMGRFLSVDPKVRRQALSAPQFYNRYSYVQGNPMKYVDPNGECAAPAGLKAGQVGICIESFIKAPTIGGLGKGDGRTFAANDPDATYRTSLRFTVEPNSGVIISRQADAGRSELIEPLSAIGAKGTQETSIVRGSDPDGTSFFIKVKGLNGMSALNTFGTIDFNVNLRVDKDGGASARTVDSKLYPSLEGYAYQIIQGELVVVPLFKIEETDPGALNEDQQRVHQSE